jgi:hypothetical protein
MAAYVFVLYIVPPTTSDDIMLSHVSYFYPNELPNSLLYGMTAHLNLIYDNNGISNNSTVTVLIDLCYLLQIRSSIVKCIV